MSSIAERDSFQSDALSLSEMMPGLLERMQIKVLEIMAKRIVEVPPELSGDVPRVDVLVSEGAREIRVVTSNAIVNQVAAVEFGHDNLGQMPLTVKLRKDTFRKNANMPFSSRSFLMEGATEHKLDIFGQSLATLFKAKRLSDKKARELSLPSSI